MYTKCAGKNGIKCEKQNAFIKSALRKMRLIKNMQDKTELTALQKMRINTEIKCVAKTVLQKMRRKNRIKCV